MTKLTELEALADAATPGPWKKLSSGEICYPYKDHPNTYASLLCCLDDDCGDGAKASTNPADTDFIAAMNPQTVKAMIALIRQQHEALKKVQPGNELGDFLTDSVMPWAAIKDIVKMEEALAAYEAFEKGGESSPLDALVKDA